MPSFPPLNTQSWKEEERHATPFCPSIPFVNRLFARSLSLLFLNRSFGCPFGRGRHFGRGSHREFLRPTLLNSRNLGHIIYRAHYAQCVKLALRRDRLSDNEAAAATAAVGTVGNGTSFSGPFWHRSGHLQGHHHITILHFGGLPDIL